MPKTTDTIEGLRFQVYPESGEVHVHDDQKSLKFIGKSQSFKDDVSEAIKDFEDGPGTVMIKGTSNEQLCLVNDGKVLYASVVSDKDFTKDIKTFLKKL